MADRVVRLTFVHKIEQVNYQDKVILKCTGTVGNRDVRVELALDAGDIECVVQKLRKGANDHASQWARVMKAIGA